MQRVKTTRPAVLDDVHRWRVETLERAGYDPETAKLLARTPDVDLHFAADLLRRGCPKETARRILL
jgi:hypothetical protein